MLRLEQIPKHVSAGGGIGLDPDETGEAIIGLEVIKEFNLPAMVTFASTDDKTIDGYTFDVAAMVLSPE